MSWYTVFSILMLTCSASVLKRVSSSETDPRVYLAVNAWAKTDNQGVVTKRRLEINWMNVDDELHQVVLYDHDPLINSSTENNLPIMVLDPLGYPDELFITDIQLPHPTSEELGYEKKCVFPYWVRIEEKGNRQGVSMPRCLELQPSWMNDNAEQLGTTLLSDLMMVGTHDSAAYKEYQGAGDDNLATLAVFAQEESLEQQLQWGVRLLDIRVGYYPTTPEKFWLVHGIIKTHPLSQGLEEVRNFLRNSKDIIIWTTNHFEQVWDEHAHTELKNLYMETFSTWWVKPDDRNLDVPLNDIWNRPDLPENQGRIIMFYKSTQNNDPSMFFHGMYSFYSNSDDPFELKYKLDAAVERAYSDPQDYHPWKACCQMTPNAEDIITGIWFGLRHMADAVNRNATKWWITEPHYQDMLSVVTSHDFILSTDMIHVGLERSLAMASKKRGFT